MAALLCVEAGVVAPGDAREDGLIMRVAHLIPPETQSSSHYVWAVSRSFRRDNAELSAQI